MKNKHILLCEDSLEGILSAVAFAFKSRYGHAYNELRINDGSGIQELFSETIEIKSDSIEAQKVYSAAAEKIGCRALGLIEDASISCFPDRADSIYRFLVLGFANGIKITECISEPHIARMMDISRNIGTETNHWIEFTRFTTHEILHEETAVNDCLKWGDGEMTLAAGQVGQHYAEQKELLGAVIEPRNRIIARIMPHFADRFPFEVFAIYDRSHDEAGIHIPDKPWAVMRRAGENEALMDILNESKDNNTQMEELWKIFFKTTDIPERYNPKLQRNLLPIWCRKNMTEFR